MKKMTRKPEFKSSEAQRTKVKNLAALGVPKNLIARRIGISEGELVQNYAKDMDRALPEMKAMVGASLFAAAKAGNVTAQIFWLKTRAGWTETIHRELSGPGGGLIEIHRMVPRRVIFLPCNGHGVCPKITDPDKRRSAYEKILGHKLPPPKSK